MLKKRRRKLKSIKSKAPDYRYIEKLVKPVSFYAPEVKCVFYGAAGTGKTTLAGTFPKPILIIDISEKGTDSVRSTKGIDVLRIEPQDPDAWQKIEDAFWYVKKSNKYKTVVIDTVSGAQEISMRRLLREMGEEPEEGQLGGWGTLHKSDWGTIAGDMKSLIFDYRSLECNVIFIAHDRTSKEEFEGDEDGGITPQVGPRLMPSVVTTLNGAVGMIGNTFIRERTREIRIGKKKRKKVLKEYCLRIGPHAYYVTKARKPKEIKCPDVLADPSYDQLLELIEGDE